MKDKIIVDNPIAMVALGLFCMTIGLIIGLSSTEVQERRAQRCEDAMPLLQEEIKECKINLAKEEKEAEAFKRHLFSMVDNALRIKNNRTLKGKDNGKIHKRTD